MNTRVKLLLSTVVMTASLFVLGSTAQAVQPGPDAPTTTVTPYVGVPTTPNVQILQPVVLERPAPPTELAYTGSGLVVLACLGAAAIFLTVGILLSIYAKDKK